MLIDSHAHLVDELYSGAKNIIDNMEKDGLKKIVAASFSIENSIESLNLAKNNKNVYCSVGVHPSEVKEDYLSYCDKLVEMGKNEKVVAIGEIGLDYHYDDTNRDLQKKGLLAQLPAALKSGLPVMFHVRDASEDMLKIVKGNLDLMPKRGVMHCFSESKETAKIYLDLGFYISFSGSVTFKNANKIKEVAAFVPLDRLMVETDCPYLTPVPFRGQPNYPKFVHNTAAEIARIRGMDIEELENITMENTMRLYSKIK